MIKLQYKLIRYNNKMLDISADLSQLCEGRGESDHRERLHHPLLPPGQAGSPLRQRLVRLPLLRGGHGQRHGPRHQK